MPRVAERLRIPARRPCRQPRLLPPQPESLRPRRWCRSGAAPRRCRSLKLTLLPWILLEVRPKPARARRLDGPISKPASSASPRPPRSCTTCENAGAHGAHPKLADKDEVGGSIPPRPTKRPLSSGNAGRSSFGYSPLGCIPNSDESERSMLCRSLSTTPTSSFFRSGTLDHRDVLGCTAVEERITAQVNWVPTPVQRVW